ncbi:MULTISPECIES: hypothetical protein [Paraburkholderia]|uniref:Uncharacterized protein n=1 Tax=Paraburkholderia madseniana TaxID=2599607 RepID=A0AAP5BDG3_9BURK|nr:MULTISPECIES: hypothetical protein [Paraburkholderia]MCX4146890.1 hypothetical protein [Paraburkholderia madseniana]MDN7149836.1 hypothetical protein [Paraburkholderia sp. WS6]MDQ6408716.1 hypothetical protein [Paraburkholderia madseniana]
MAARILPIFNRASVADDRGSDAGDSHASFSPMKRNLLQAAKVTLAGTATATSLYIAALSGLERGATLAERLACTAVPVVTVAGLHLLPALSRGQSFAVRGLVAVLCTAGLVVTLSSQISFFQLAQQHAGTRRAESVLDTARVPVAGTPGRSLTAIAHDQASARKTLALIDSHHCDGNCTSEHLRRTTLTATLEALAIEADEARRREAAEDRQVVLVDRTLRLRDAMRDDPVIVRLADLTGLGKTSVSLLLGLVYACVLDGIGVFGWYLVMPAYRRDGDAVTALVVATSSGVERKYVEADKAVDTDSGITSHSPLDEVDSQLMQLTRDVSEGKVHATVAGIRKYLGCSQATALKLRRGLQGPLAAASQSKGGGHVR